MRDLKTRQADQIKAMRVLLLVMVLYIHSVRPVEVPIEWSWDGQNFFRIYTEIFSHYIGGLALCWFFFFSGYLFFHNLEEGQFGREWVVQKWKRRVKSILGPYVIWNVLDILAILLVTAVFAWAGKSLSGNPMEDVRRGPLFWFVTGPIDFPLWYLRNLVLLSIIAPFLYHPIKKHPWITLTVLLVIYFATIYGVRFPLFPDIVFFGIGAIMSIRRKNIISFCHQNWRLALMVSVFFLFLTVLSYNSGYDDSVFLFFAPFGMVTLWNVCYALCRNKHVKRFLIGLTETVFFVYAVHEIFILGWIKGLFIRLLGESLWAQWVTYLLVPLVTLGVCLGLFYLLKLIMPRVLQILCGFRTLHKVDDPASYRIYR